MASLNKVTLIGRLGRDPEKRNFNNGGSVVSFGLATSEKWKDKATGEWKEKTEWHQVVIFNEKIAEVAEKYLVKGSMAYIEGQIQSRKYEKDGAERTSYEIVVPKFGGALQLLDKKGDGGGDSRAEAPARAERPTTKAGGGDWDEVPF